MVSAVITAPENATFQVKKGVFSGKGFAIYEITTANKVVTIAPNTFRPEETGSAVAVEQLEVDVPKGRIRVKNQSTIDGVVPLPEAELVVSAGRGMKSH